MHELITTFANEPGLLVGTILGIAGMLTSVVIIALISRSARQGTREREQTRREIAAYVAEGTLTSEDAERLLSPSPWWIKTVCVKGKDVRESVREHLHA